MHLFCASDSFQARVNSSFYGASKEKLKFMNDNQTPLSPYCKGLLEVKHIHGEITADCPAILNRSSVAEIQGFSGPQMIIDIILCSLFSEE